MSEVCTNCSNDFNDGAGLELCDPLCPACYAEHLLEAYDAIGETSEKGE